MQYGIEREIPRDVTLGPFVLRRREPEITEIGKIEGGDPVELFSQNGQRLGVASITGGVLSLNIEPGARVGFETNDLVEVFNVSLSHASRGDGAWRTQGSDLTLRAGREKIHLRNRGQ